MIEIPQKEGWPDGDASDSKTEWRQGIRVCRSQKNRGAKISQPVTGVLSPSVACHFRPVKFYTESAR
jgi:hypothetical protein